MHSFEPHDLRTRQKQATAVAWAALMQSVLRALIVLGIAAGLLALLHVHRAQAETASSGEALPSAPVASLEEAPSQDRSNEAFPSPAGKQPPSSGVAVGPAGYRAMVEAEATRAGLPPEIADSVMAVESAYNPAAIGGVGEICLMQILPSTARMLGFTGTPAELAVPQTNIRYGVTYLAKAWRLAGGDLCTAVMKYRAGHGESRFSHLSVNYCLAVRGKLAARGYRVTGSVPVATFGLPGGGGSSGCKRKCLAGTQFGRIDLAALNTRLSTLVVQVRAGR
jgi:soluble lytic murein transglycosylase-like protein